MKDKKNIGIALHGEIRGKSIFFLILISSKYVDVHKKAKHKLFAKNNFLRKSLMYARYSYSTKYSSNIVRIFRRE